MKEQESELEALTCKGSPCGSLPAGQSVDHLDCGRRCGAARCFSPRHNVTPDKDNPVCLSSFATACQHFSRSSVTTFFSAHTCIFCSLDYALERITGGFFLWVRGWLFIARNHKFLMKFKRTSLSSLTLCKNYNTLGIVLQRR